MKKFFLMLVGLLAALPALARDFTYTYQGQTLIYTVLDETAKTCETKKGSGYQAPGNSITGDLVIPSIAKDDNTEYQVISIGIYAFYWCSDLKSVTIPNSVISIGLGAFAGCSDLNSVTIPNSVISIENDAFAGCSSLTSVTIPNSVTSIENDAFAGCSSLNSVLIPNSVCSIGDDAFNGCSSLISVTIPESVNSIGHEVFCGCSSLEAFNGKFASADHRCLVVDGTLNSFAPAELTSYSIPRSVTSIGNGAFASCNSLISVTIPNSVTSIGNDAFAWCRSLTSVSIPNSVTSIGNDAFAWCRSLTSVSIPNSVTSIGNDAFAWCRSLTSVTIPNSVTSIGKNAFSSCYSLTSVTIPNSVISIGDHPFNGCSSLEAFNGKFASADHRCLVVDGTLNSFAPAGLKSYSIPTSVTSIGNYAFGECSLLTSVTIPNSVTSIEDVAFGHCNSLISVTIPNSVTSIGKNAFFCCSSLISVTIPNSVTSIGYGAFYSCGNLKAIYVMSQTPPACGSSVFDGVDYSLCNLYVPEGSEPLYQSTDPWWTFQNIKANPIDYDYDLTLAAEPLPQGKSVAMPLMLTNPADVVTVQFDLYLPDGITLDKDEYGDFIITPGERCNSTHIFSSSTVDGCIRVVGYSSKNRPYAATDAPLIYLPLSASADIEPGQSLAVQIRNIYVTELEGLKEVRLPDSQSNIDIIDPYIRGDVNNDGRFSATDIACCLALILGQEAQGAIPEAADVNGDGTISATDIANIVSLIMAGDATATNLRNKAVSRAEDANEGETEVITPAYYMNPVKTDTGSNATLEVGLCNPETQAVTLQCDIFLPEGVEVETDEYGDPIIDLEPARSAGHVITVGKIGNGAYRVVSYSDRNRPYKGTDGVIFTLPLVVEATSGEYEIRMEKSYITEAGTLREIACPDCQTTLTVGISGIEEISMEAATPQYYNLQGMKLGSEKPAPGIYIVRRGNKVTKEIVK